MTIPTLSILDARVLGVLVEKQRTVPDTYPLTLNALVGGCNQKTSRHPVMSATEGKVLAALDRLKADAWIVETSGGRVMRYAHNVERVLGIPAQSVAILSTLMLRGPQTAAELRANCDRLHRFADVSAVEAFLHELARRSAGGLVVELPRVPGTREARWTDLLSGTPPESSAHEATPAAAPAMAPAVAPAVAHAGSAAANAPREIEVLRSELADLRRDLDRLGATVAALSAKLAGEPPVR